MKVRPISVDVAERILSNVADDILSELDQLLSQVDLGLGVVLNRITIRGVHTGFAFGYMMLYTACTHAKVRVLRLPREFHGTLADELAELQAGQEWTEGSPALLAKSRDWTSKVFSEFLGTQPTAGPFITEWLEATGQYEESLKIGLLLAYRLFMLLPEPPA